MRRILLLLCALMFLIACGCATSSGSTAPSGPNQPSHGSGY